MQGQHKTLLIVAFAAMVALVCSNVSASFDKATRAYLLGDFEKARYESLVAATDGDPKAQMLLGQLYFNGEGVKKDINHAIYWYEKAAESEFSDAQYRLGMLYHDGKKGVTKDLDKAYKWLIKAYDNGYKKAKTTLDWLHKTEQGKVVNLSEDVEVLKKVAGSGNKQARFLLSEKMIKGAGIPQDKVGAVKLLTEDAKQGFIKAQKKLGEVYFFGEGVEKNYIEAYGWSMAYAGTKELGGIAREGKQTARSSLRKLPEETHNEAYLKSKEYFENYVLPFHANAREVGPEKYRIVVRSRIKKGDIAKAKTAESKAKQSANSPVPATKPVAKSTATSKVLPTQGAKQTDSPLVNAPVSKISPDKQSASEKEAVSETATTKNGLTVPSVLPTPDAIPAIVEATQSSNDGEGEKKEDSKRKLESASPPASESTLRSDTKEQAQKNSIQPETDKSSINLAGTEAVADVAVDSQLLANSGQQLDLEQTVAGERPASLEERKFDDVYNVLVRKKSSLLNMYYKEYELDKKLQGRVVFELLITPDGKISQVEVITNTVESPTLEQTMVDYLKNSIKFESLDVADFKITYPVDFYPP